MAKDWKASGWLSLITAGPRCVELYDPATFKDGVAELVHEITKLHAVKAKAAPQAIEGASDDLDDIFSVKELRSELDRLRESTQVHNSSNDDGSGSIATHASLPNSVPAVPDGVRSTDVMRNILQAVLHGKETQVGFCGMGGIGKTTLSTWVVHQEAVRARFNTICWVPLGQTPDMEAMLALLYLQVSGRAFAQDLPELEKQQLVTQALAGKNVLLVLDDGWDSAHTSVLQQHIDSNTPSKILVSSRVKEVVEGGQLFNLELPTIEAATTMLLQTAGHTVAPGSQPPKEAAAVAKFCNRLPLMIGIAGKLIQNIAGDGGDDTSWDGIIELLKDELDDSEESNSVEQSVIRASLQSIAPNRREEAAQLLSAFALVPEDAVCPLGVLEMIYQAAAQVKTPSRQRLRVLLKTLVNRSLVLGKDPCRSFCYYTLVFFFATWRRPVQLHKQTGRSACMCA